MSGGGVHVNQTKKKLWQRCIFFAFLLVLRIFYRNQMINFKEIHHFSRFRRGSNFFRRPGSNFFQGEGSNCLFPIETHITRDFPGGVWTPCPPSGSALDCDLFSFPVCDHLLQNDAITSCTCACFPATSFTMVVCFQSSPAIESFLELTA